MDIVAISLQSFKLATQKLTFALSSLAGPPAKRVTPETQFLFNQWHDPELRKTLDTCKSSTSGTKT